MLLQLKNISKSFGNPSDNTFQSVLKSLSLDVSESDTIAVLGPSGSGKSTLLNLIGALDMPDEGKIIFKGNNITGMTSKELDHYRNREIGFVFQFHHLLPQCTLFENVLIPSLSSKTEAKEKHKYAEELLNRVGLWEHRYKFPGQMSGGECQRTALVRAMINNPSLLLADEPSGALDRKNVDVLSDLLLKLNAEEKITLILVTHSGRLAGKMNTVYELVDGSLKKS